MKGAALKAAWARGAELASSVLATQKASGFRAAAEALGEHASRTAGLSHFAGAGASALAGNFASAGQIMADWWRGGAVSGSMAEGLTHLGLSSNRAIARQAAVYGIGGAGVLYGGSRMFGRRRRR